MSGSPFSPAVERTVEFACPGCGKQFTESRHAAGRKTRCPRCEAVFVIPSAEAPTERSLETSHESTAESSPAPRSAMPPPVATAGASAPPAEGNQTTLTGAQPALQPIPQPEKFRVITRGTAIPLGLMLLMLGGALTVLGMLCTVGGYMRKMEKQTGMAGLGDAGNIIGGQARLIEELSQEPALRPRRGRGGNDPLKGLAERLQPKKSKPEDDKSDGTVLLYGGVAASVFGSLLTFIGGIFLFAGLMSRFREEPTRPIYAPLPAREQANG